MRYPPSSELKPCACPECYQAGMHTRPQLVDKHGQPLHGYELKRVWEARDAFWRLVDEKFDRRKGTK